MYSENLDACGFLWTEMQESLHFHIRMQYNPSWEITYLLFHGIFFQFKLNEWLWIAKQLKIALLTVTWRGWELCPKPLWRLPALAWHAVHIRQRGILLFTLLNILLSDTTEIWVCLQGSAMRWSPGCVNAADKARQKWQAWAGTKFTKPGDRLLAEPFTYHD